MSIVRYKNPTTGRISVYESTSYYDPELKQSRPKRHYLGTEDPITGELIRSTGKRGRPKKQTDTSATQSSPETVSRHEYEQLCSTLKSKDAEITQLREKCASLSKENLEMRKILQRIGSAVTPYIP